MFDYMKKTFLTGVGLALRSKDEIGELAREFAKKSKMSQDEARDFFKECEDRYEEAREKFDKKVESAMEKLMKKLDLPTRSDIKALNDRIDALSRKLPEEADPDA